MQVPGDNPFQHYDNLKYFTTVTVQYYINHLRNRIQRIKLT